MLVIHVGIQKKSFKMKESNNISLKNQSPPEKRALLLLLSKKKGFFSRSKVQLNLSSNIETEAHVGTYQGNEILIPRD